MALLIFFVSELLLNSILCYLNSNILMFPLSKSYITVQHTSASLTINENYDSDVQDDTETFLSRIVPEVT